MTQARQHRDLVPVPGGQRPAPLVPLPLRRLPRGPAMRHVPDDCAEAPIRQGLAILIGFFGLIGSLLLLAPMNGAVVASGTIAVEGSRKSIQHLDGGIVRALKVKEGQSVSAGDTLLVLDDTQAKAELDVLRQLYAGLRLGEARLTAELTGAAEPVFPPELAEERDDPAIAALWRTELEQHRRRGEAMSGRGGIIAEKVAQLAAQVAGAEVQRASVAAQIKSITAELKSLAPLLQRGLITKPRVLQLERSLAQLQGQQGEIEGAIAHARQAIAEQREQSTQVGRERFSDAAQELAAVRGKLAETAPRLMAARAALARTIVTSPYSGRVVALGVVSVGAVVTRGERIMDIVPAEEELVIEARVGVDDIAEVRPDMRAQVRLTAFKQRAMPLIGGTVSDISADRLSDPHSNVPYYLAHVRVAAADLASVPGVQLYPGMPATVMIPTESRSAFQYLVSPLTSAFAAAGRER